MSFRLTRCLAALAGALLVVAGGTAPAWSQPDLSGFDIIASPGFPSVCAAPCYQVEKTFDVWLAGNPTGPIACGAGENLFVYNLTHIGGTLPFPSVAITEFEVTVDFSIVGSAGFIPGPGIAPIATTIQPIGAVGWDFPDSTACPACLDQGKSSVDLFICSTGAPGTRPDIVSTTAGIDAQGECVVPIAPECQLDLDKTCCIPTTPAAGVDVCEGKVLSAIFEVVGGNCADTTNDQEGKAKCTGPDPLPGDVGSVDITITKDSTKIAANGTIGGTTGVPIGSTVEFTNEEDAPNVKELKASTKFDVSGPGGTQSLTIHTSCSKALRCGDQFGSLQLVEITTTEGGTIVCPDPDAEGTQCVQDPGTPFACEDKISQIVFEWTGDACQTPLPNPQEGKAECSGTVSGAEPVNVTYTGGDQDKITVDPASDIDIGEQFSITATGRDDLKASTKFVVDDGVGVVQNVEIHTSCSKDIDCGDEFGGFKIISIVGTDGSSCDLTPPGPLFQDACEVPLAPPTPHCTSKVNELQLAYIGDALGFGCSVTNSQDGKASCTGVDDPGTPVSITITKDADKIVASPDSGINAPTVATVDIVSFTNEEDAPLVKELPSSLEFDVTGGGGTQSIKIHTSCSQPLNLGDVFGSFAVVGIDRKDDGLISLGGQVEYQYTVTNPNTAPAITVNNVAVNDNPLGPIVSGETLAPGESKTFFKTATLFSTLTNQATVSGDDAGSGNACEIGEDEVTVDVLLPPQGSFDCSDAKPIDQLSMEWAGAQVDVCIKAWDGAVGGTLLKQQKNVFPGDVVTVNGMGGSPNDQVWEIFLNDLCTNKLGESEFHISCSDPNMNGIEDCGSAQGNGKSNDPALINDWLLEGIKGDATLDCTPDPIVVPGPSSCGLGFELLFVLPPLAWLRGRRRRRPAA